MTILILPGRSLAGYKLREMVETTTAVLDSLFQINTILLAGSILNNGNKNMSYHVQQNTQQKSLGIFIVIAFHLLLIWGLANGLGATIGNIFIPENITLTPQQEKVTPREKIDPQEVVIQPKNIITSTTDPQPLTFEESVKIDRTNDLGGGVIERTTTVTKPRLIHASKPDYPAAAARLGEEGATGLNLYVDAKGRVSEATVFSSSGSTRLDDAAIKHALRNWAFTPCMDGDKAVACWHQTKMVWRLEDAKR